MTNPADVRCAECGAPTMPPYTSASGTHFPGHYCESCGYTTFPERTPR